ncbi:UDP-N-acetylmuramoyl-L-alanine--D-glutamate ligase [Deferrisoma sp.]
MTQSAYEASRILVVGAGRSGLAAARYLVRAGARVEVHDDRPVELPPDLGADLRGRRPLEEYDLAVVSPGIPPRHPVWRGLREAGVAVLGELELAARHLACPLVAVTGTNGKSTVTEMLGRVFRAAGRRAFVGGNLGTPLVEALGGEWDLAVAEVSSFQLATAESLRPRVAVLLNVDQDHLDWHGSAEAYREAKAGIFRNQGPGDAAVAFADDPVAWGLARRGRGTLLGFSETRPQPAGAWLEGREAVVLLPGEDGVRLPAEKVLRQGRHRVRNALAAVVAAGWMGVPPETAWETIGSFPGLPHRMEAFLEWNGVRFVDDSKATNVHAAREALAACAGPVVWLAGGQAKGQDLTPLAEAAQGRVREAIAVGEAAPELVRVLRDAVPVRAFDGWEEAVEAAVDRARPGDVVLLSPACASFDRFSGYAERGRVFQDLCRRAVERRADRGRG